MRIQLDFDEQGISLIDRLKQESGVTTYKDLFNNALTLFDWALKQRAQGRIVGSVDEDSSNYRELQMPVLEHAARTHQVVAAGRSRRSA